MFASTRSYCPQQYCDPQNLAAVSEEVLEALMTINEKEPLKQRISNVQGVSIAVVGVGYVGQPLGVLLADKGFTVFGVDVNRDRIKLLEKGETTLEGVDKDRLKKVVLEDKKLIPLHIVDVDENDPKSSPAPSALEPLAEVDIFI